MIKLSRLLSNTPIPVVEDIYFSQPTLNVVEDMGEEEYWSLLKIWSLSDKDLMFEGHPELDQLSNFEKWIIYAFGSIDFSYKIINSIDCFLGEKVEFLPVSHTIIIGENKKVLLDEVFYNRMRLICDSMDAALNNGSEQETQYQEVEHMSDREREMVRKMRERQKTLDNLRNGGDSKTEKGLINQIIGLAAIGHYTFEEIYNMTVLQVVYLLKKCIDLQQYELYIPLSPFMDSKKGQSVKYWLDS